jgi:hypothetical protein
MKKTVGRKGISQIVTTLLLFASLTACDSKFNFEAVQEACEPPESSARYGKFRGPVITGPSLGTLTNGNVTIQGTCVDGLDVYVGGKDGSTALVPCTAGVFNASMTLSGSDGRKEIDVYQKTEDFDVLDRTCFQKDATPPKVTISGSGGMQSIGTTNIIIEGKCEAGLPVQLSGPDMPVSVIAQCENNRFSALVALTSVDGVKTVIAEQIDIVGNVGKDDQAYITDRIAPVVRIVTPIENAIVPLEIDIAGICDGAEGRVILSGSGLSKSLSADCLSGAFAVKAKLKAPDGAKTLTAAQTDIAGNVGFDIRNVVLKTAEQGYVTFRSKGAGGLVDILFVDDNSGSMAGEQLELGRKFASFASELSSVSWQIGVTTTDCSNGPFGICGSLLEMGTTGLSILTKAVPNFQAVFEQTIRRPETYDPVTGRDCNTTSTCPSGDEVPLKASISAMGKRNTDNRNFFRDGADLSIVYLSDEDEESTGGSGATEAKEVVEAFNTIWPSDKKFIAYGIVIRPGDQACLDQQRAAGGSLAGSYATKVADLVDLTGGSLYSICDSDYSLTLKDIGRNVTRYSKSVTLAQTPIKNSVRVVFTPAWNSTVTVTGKTVTINNPAPVGTVVEIYYNY